MNYSQIFPLDHDILQTSIDNPLQSVLHGFRVEELVQNIFRVNEETDLKDYRQAKSGGPDLAVPAATGLRDPGQGWRAVLLLPF